MRELSSRPYIDLLDSVALTAREQPAAFRQIRVRLSEIREWFLDRTAWPVILTRDLVRLVKTPALSHPGQGFAWAKEPLDYEILLWVLWYGERLSSDQFVLTDLVRELELSVAARIGHGHLNWDQRPHRASLKRVLDALEEMQALRRLDGALEGFVERREGDSLYEFTFLASHFRVNLVGQADGTLDRSVSARHRLYRGLLLSPALYVAEDEEAFAVLKRRDRRQSIAADFLSTLGWDLEVTPSYACLLRPSVDLQAQNVFPTQATISHILLLFCGWLHGRVEEKRLSPDANGCVSLSRDELWSALAELKHAYGTNWSKLYREMSLASLFDAVETALRSWSFLTGPDQDDHYRILPATARFSGVYRDDGQGLAGGDEV